MSVESRNLLKRCQDTIEERYIPESKRRLSKAISMVSSFHYTRLDEPAVPDPILVSRPEIVSEDVCAAIGNWEVTGKVLAKQINRQENKSSCCQVEKKFKQMAKPKLIKNYLLDLKGKKDKDEQRPLADMHSVEMDSAAVQEILRLRCRKSIFKLWRS